jgi:DNA-binding XRE family transcriptional regulator
MALIRKRNRLREIRRELGLSAFDLQLMCFVNHQRIYLIERGIVRPTHAQKVAIAEALKRSVEEIFPPQMARNQTLTAEA